MLRRRDPDAPPPFATEVELCTAFMDAVKREPKRKDFARWTPYPETAGWDILLVRQEDGFQIGIEAKLKLNIDVVNQAIERGSTWEQSEPGPNCRAVLVPEYAGPHLEKVCGYIGLTIIRMRQYGRGVRGPDFTPYLPQIVDQWNVRDEWYECCPVRRCRLPEYVPDVIAGDKAPLRLTSWKISAIKLQITLETRGYLTRADFKHLSIDHRRFTAKGAECLIPDGARCGGSYTAGKRFPDFRQEHPVNFEQIKADAEKWMLKLNPPPLSAKQETMI